MPDPASLKKKLTREVDKEIKEQPEELDEHVKPEQLEKAWYDYVNKLKEKERTLEYNALNQKVEFSDDLTIHLTLPNSFQSLTIEELRQELLGHLRQQLRNKNINLKTSVEKLEDKKLIYTNKEKFDYLAEKYPVLRKLRSKLDLDTDF